ncbi:uncharacterized protein LOC126682451 [Mercurialis annua]|uniref:uncharacterized protein LOC126682451 n=1 Tax=Mercurialis annua TaxID=3986 RepID=UPI002160E96D|nr:uncharacterized protein LOC126682451 [Mercurialis annua]
MDGGDGWRVINYAGGAQDKSMFNQMMLRFRPIAPKPANGLDSNHSSLKNNSVLVSKRRKKRKYVRVCKNNRSLRRTRKKICLASSSSSSDQEKGKQNEIGEDGGFNKTVTLQLLPETSDYSTERERSWCNQLNNNNNNNQDEAIELKLKQPSMVDLNTSDRRQKVVVESWVTVECVTDAYEGGGLGCTDMERLKNLEDSTCPGFISDGSDTVKWINGAYKRMMMMTTESSSLMEIIVWLVTKEKLTPYVYSSAFTCWVRLQYYITMDDKEKSKNSSRLVPCDVWRMECGGFAWRLDVEAALSLGR